MLGVWFIAGCGRLVSMRALLRLSESIAATLLFCASMVQAQGVWRGIDAEGVPVYSDHALPDARALPAPLTPPNFSSVSRYRSAEPPPSPTKALESTLPHIAALGEEGGSQVQIKNPQDQLTIRNNRGEIAVDLELSDQIAEQILRLQLWLDGRLALEAAPDQRSFLLRDVPRGTHQLELRALHTDGTWRRSDAHTVFLHRASRLH